jgi:hypothetical protein
MDFFGSNNFNLESLMGGADEATPLPDVSMGGEDMQPSTPTGNGSGVFVDSTMQQNIFGGLSKVLDYALQRDAYKMNMQRNLQYQQPVMQQQVQAQGRQTNFLFLAACAVGIFLLVKE